jgi:hypothetical protein
MVARHEVPGIRKRREPVPPGRIAFFYASPGTSYLATLMSPSGTISRRAITIKLALMAIA